MSKEKSAENQNPLAGLAILAVIVGFTLVACSGGDDESDTDTTDTTATQEQVDPRRALIDEWEQAKQGQPVITVPYADLFRDAEKYRGKFIKFKGEVIQVLGDAGEWNLRVNVTDKSSYGVSLWDDTIFVFSYSNKRVIEDDIIEFVGRGDGTQTYESALGGEVTIPAVTTLDTPVVGRSE